MPRHIHLVLTTLTLYRSATALRQQYGSILNRFGRQKVGPAALAEATGSFSFVEPLAILTVLARSQHARLTLSDLCAPLRSQAHAPTHIHTHPHLNPRTQTESARSGSESRPSCIVDIGGGGHTPDFLRPFLGASRYIAFDATPRSIRENQLTYALARMKRS